MKYPRRSQYKYAKSPYRIRNWPEYEAGLRRRGDLTIWFSDDAIKSWRAPTGGQPGGQRIYANVAIEATLTIRMVFHLPLRQTEGFLRSLVEKLELNIPIPDHTTLSRRVKTLGEIPFRAVRRPPDTGPLESLDAAGHPLDRLVMSRHTTARWLTMSKLKQCLGANHQLVISAMLFVAALGCAGDTVELESVSVHDSAGITIVENASPVWAEDERWRLSDGYCQVKLLAARL
jgi:hypothetical protein